MMSDQDVDPTSLLSRTEGVVTRAPVTNWVPHGVTLAGYCYAVRLGMKVQLVTPYRVICNVTNLRYAVTVQVWTLNLHTKTPCSSGRYVFLELDLCDMSS